VVGSEGTLGIVTSATVRLVRLPEEVRTVLVGFESTDQAGAATSAIISAGILPAAIEMMDALAIEAAEEAVRCGYPEGAGAVLVIELDGARSRWRRSTTRSSGCAPRTARSSSGSPPTPSTGR
jgi:glycolate oxidase